MKFMRKDSIISDFNRTISQKGNGNSAQKSKEREGEVESAKRSKRLQEALKKRFETEMLLSTIRPITPRGHEYQQEFMTDGTCVD